MAKSIQEEVKTLTSVIRNFCNQLTAISAVTPPGSSCDAPSFSKDCDRQELIDKLQNILEAVDGLELTTENIRIEAGQINLNTDEVEEKLDVLIELHTPPVIQNKSYKLSPNQSITFEYESVYEWQAGVFNGEASFIEGDIEIGTYTQGESFGNGDSMNRILNLTEITIKSLTDGDVRISVMQSPDYNPIITNL